MIGSISDKINSSLVQYMDKAVFHFTKPAFCFIHMSAVFAKRLCHRHNGCDIFCSAPHPKFLCAAVSEGINIRALLNIKKADTLWDH